MTAATSEKAKTDLLNCFVDGVVVDPRIGYPRFEFKLTAKDLGLDEKEVPELFKLGKKLLIDKRALSIFSSIEGKARREVEFYSFNFPIPGLRFVPHRVLERLVTTLEDLKVEFNEKAKEFLQKYDQLKTETMEKYAAHRQAIEKLYPTVGAVADGFTFQYQMFSISLPTKLHKKAVDLKTSEDAKNKVNSIVDQKTRELVAGFDKWAEDIVISARKAALEIFYSVKQKIDKGEVINSKSIESLKNYVDAFRNMNFVGDTKMEEALKSCKDILDSGMNSKFAKDQAKQVLDQVVSAASSVSDVSQVTGAYRRRLMTTEE